MLHKVMSRASEHLIPFQAALELTYRCNLRCRHCYVDAPACDELSLIEWQDAIDQLAAEGALYLLLTGGEPLVRNDFYEIAEYARGRGFVLMVLTNGTLIGRDGARRLAEIRPLFVGLSLYGATPPVHDLVTGVPGSFSATLRAVRLLSELGVPVHILGTVMECNAHEAGAMKELAAGIGAPLALNYELTATKSGSQAPLRHRTTGHQLCQFAEPEWLAGPDVAGRDTIGPCNAGRGACSVSPNGGVFPCVMMPLRLGSLRLSRFADIWRASPSSELVRLRSIQPDDFVKCNDCNLSSYCRSCMGRNFAETGDMTGPAPSACRNAALRHRILDRREVTHERAL